MLVIYRPPHLPLLQHLHPQLHRPRRPRRLANSNHYWGNNAVQNTAGRLPTGRGVEWLGHYGHLPDHVWLEQRSCSEANLPDHLRWLSVHVSNQELLESERCRSLISKVRLAESSQTSARAVSPSAHFLSWPVYHRTRNFSIVRSISLFTKNKNAFPDENNYFFCGTESVPYVVCNPWTRWPLSTLPTPRLTSP